jgi:DNA-binding response OmpR family regulator
MADNGRILIVEADLLVRHPLAEYLRECGYRVVEAGDGAEARVLLEHDALPIDIVLAEGAAGLELATWIRAKHPDVQLILVGSVTRATEKAGELCEEGPDVTKPYEHKLVLERIRRLTAARERAKEK